MTSTAAVNPARAGMILRSLLAQMGTHCKPRASGDDPPGAPLTVDPYR